MNFTEESRAYRTPTYGDPKPTSVDLNLQDLVEPTTMKEFITAPKPAVQIGGDHYSKLGIEPIQFIETNEMGYHEGNVVKYVSRWRSKNGLEDLKKAQWYINRLIELNYPQD